MTTEHDSRTRTVLSWLREDAHENAERVLLRALDEVDATPQRRSWWPARRPDQMTRLFIAAAAAAAVLVVALVGYKLLPTSNVGGESAAPSLAPTPTAPPASPAADPTMEVGPLAAGTHRVTENTYVPYEITVPAGWRFDADGNFAKGDATEAVGVTGVSVTTWFVSHIYGDSCQWQGTFRPAGTKRLMALELAQQTGHATSGPTEATFGGDPATLINVSLDAEFDVNACDLNIVRLWPDPGPDESGGLRLYPGQTRSVFVMEQDGKTLVGVVTEAGTLPRALRIELEDVVASIDFQH